MNENTMTKKELIIAAMEDMSDSELLCIHREYLDAVNGYDDYIYSMDEFDEILHGQTPEWIANRVFYGDFNPNYEYFKFNGYGNLQSICSYELKDYIYIDDIAAYIVDNDDALYNAISETYLMNRRTTNNEKIL